MKQKRFSSLWAVFAMITFLVLSSTAILLSAAAVLLLCSGYDEVFKESPLSLIFILLLLSVVFGTVMFLFVGRLFMEPIKSLSEASKEVAKGNFAVNLNEENRIKEIHELAANFNIMVQELSGIETLRNDFVTNVSHEFKTPLAAIEGYAALLQRKGLSDSEYDEYVKMIIGSSRQLSILTENILNLSKLENQEVVLDQKKFRLDEQIRESILLLESKWSEKDIELVIELDKISYYGNKNLLKQVWLNLIDNAVKFTAENGKIGISLREDSGEIVVKIHDNGRGMDVSEINHIFDKFYQSDKARKETGNGLGLALVKRIVDLCKGTVLVESRIGSGSEFIVRLPHEGETLYMHPLK